MLVADFDYDLPEEAIAQRPVEPRDRSRLLVVPSLEDRRFRDLPELLDSRDVVVVNRTRVLPARLDARKTTGGAVEVLLTRRRSATRWQALVRPARKVRAGTRLIVGDLAAEVSAGPEEGVVELVFLGDPEEVDATIADYGEVPLPPYIHEPLADAERYQTIFADRPGSAAAPTAGLHFSPELLDRLGERGVEVAAVDLTVGLDTFRPMREGSLAEHRIHAEHYEVPAETAAAVERARRAGGRVVAVGTTVVRALESAAPEPGRITPGAGETELFIVPGYRARIVDALVTNFHAPRTTLLAMIAALVGPSWRHIYATALERGYRFLSFGDAMFVERIEPWPR